jgi:hypothetical protein
MGPPQWGVDDTWLSSALEISVNTESLWIDGYLEFQPHRLAPSITLYHKWGKCFDFREEGLIKVSIQLGKIYNDAGNL